MTLIWATRGRTWGYRFLLNGGHPDPLPVYDEVFSHLGDEREACVRIGDKIALRFPDPLGRKDIAGRVILHEFVISPPISGSAMTVEDGIRDVWEQPGIADRYSEVWELPSPT